MKRLGLIAVLFGCGCGSTFFEEGLGPKEREAKITEMRDGLEQKKSELKAAEAEVEKCATEREEVVKKIESMEDTDSDEGVAEYNKLAERHAELEQAGYEAEEKVYVLQDEVEELEYNLDCATQEHTGRLEEEAYEADLAKAEADATKAEADATKAEADAAKAEADAAAAKKAEEDAAAAKKAEEAASKQAVDDEVKKGNALTLEGLGLFSKITGKMGALPEDQGELKALQAENQAATDKLNEAKTTFAGVRGKVADPSKIDAKTAQIDKLLALLKGYDDRIKAKLN